MIRFSFLPKNRERNIDDDDDGFIDIAGEREPSAACERLSGAVRAGSDRVRVKITQNRNNFKRKFTIFFFKVHSLLANNSEREI
jgi:hypothetical protein